VIGIGTALAPTVSTAATVTVATFTSCAISAGCGTSPYGTVTLNTVTGVYTVTLASDLNFFQAGTPPLLAINTTAGGTVTPTGTGSANTGSTLTSFGPTPPGNPPAPLGTFDNSIATSAHNTLLGQTLTFTITGALLANSVGDVFAADVIVGGVNGATGWIDATLSPSPVPIPPAALLFGSALVGLGVLGRSRRKNKGLVQA